MSKLKPKAINPADSVSSLFHESDAAAIRQSSKTLDEMLAAQAIDVEAVVADFIAARQQDLVVQKKLNKKVI
jgi:hypothetical protein